MKKNDIAAFVPSLVKIWKMGEKNLHRQLANNVSKIIIVSNIRQRKLIP